MLRDITFREAPFLTDRLIINILKHCPTIASVEISGDLWEGGQIKGNFASFMEMRQNKKRWKSLNVMVFNE